MAGPIEVPPDMIPESPVAETGEGIPFGVTFDPKVACFRGLRGARMAHTFDARWWKRAGEFPVWAPIDQDPTEPARDEALSARLAAERQRNVGTIAAVMSSAGEAQPEAGASLPTDADFKTTGDLLSERGKTHGNFLDNGTVSQDLKTYLREETRADGSHGWDRLTIVQRESLDMIVHKIGRIMGGDADFRDHWDDIAGYAKLAAERCSK